MHFGVFEILTLLGSLGLFLYGMKTMSDALMAVAGDKMRKILASMTRNRVLAVLTGLLVTTVIQSSSATTLMVVSFVNAQLFTLVEAIGVIMGANIGTTVTAWVITILGFKVSMNALALPLVALGFVLSFSKKPNRANWGSFTIGFAVLFIGLQFLKESVPDINQNPQALAWLTAYTDMGYLSVLLFLAIGTILTVIIQSSSATMALTLVMCFEGWIPFEMAAAMVLGENIGTTITANLASLVGGQNGKRAARAHLIFNVLGVLWILLLFYPFLHAIENLVTTNGQASPFKSAVAIPVALSAFHTVFNIINTSLLVWFLPLIERIVIRMVPDKVDKTAHIGEPKFLNENILSYSPSAIKALIDESQRVFDEPVYEIMARAFHIDRSALHHNLEPEHRVAPSRNVSDGEINERYYKRTKRIYGVILEYTYKVPALFKLSQEKADEIYQIRSANRMAISAIKRARGIQNRMDEYKISTNADIRLEYDQLRKIMMEVLKAVYAHHVPHHADAYRAKITQLKQKLDKDEVELNKRLQRMVNENKITNAMAVSLINDMDNIEGIAHNLRNAVDLLYFQLTPIMEEMEDEAEVSS